jgi:20S proteasome subunit alpha 4
VRGKSCVVLGVEKKTVLKLQEARSVKKIAKLDDKVCVCGQVNPSDGCVLVVMISLSSGQSLFIFQSPGSL